MNIEKVDFVVYQVNKSYKRLELFLLGLLLSILAGCSTTGVVPIGKGAYMVAKRNAGGMFSSANAMKPELFREANAFCVEQQKQLVVVGGELGGELGPGLHIAQHLVFYKNILLPQCLFYGR